MNGGQIGQLLYLGFDDKLLSLYPKFIALQI